MDKNKKLFPQRLWELIHDDKYSFCLRWSQDGQRVYLNRNEFETHYLKTPSNQFHTQKAISFVRQMNMYGFRKVDDCFYENDNFKRNCPHLLKNMIRKHSNRTYFSPPPPPPAPILQPQPQPQPQPSAPHHLHSAGAHPASGYPLPPAGGQQHLSRQQHQRHQQALAAFSQQAAAPLPPELGGAAQQQQVGAKQAALLSQAELRRIHQHLQDSTLVSSLQQLSQRHQHSPPDQLAGADQSCFQAAEVARSLSSLGAAMAAQTPLASSLYYRLAGFNFGSGSGALSQQQPQPAPSGADQEQQQQLFSQLMQARNQLAATNNPNSLLARPPAPTCLEQPHSSPGQLAGLQQQHCHHHHHHHHHQQHQQQQQLRTQLSQHTSNQLNFLDSTSRTLAASAGLSAAEQVALQENLVRTFLQLHTTTTTAARHHSGQQPAGHTHSLVQPGPTQPGQLQSNGKPFLLRTLQEQNLLQSLATISSGEPRPAPRASSPLELVVKKR